MLEDRIFESKLRVSCGDITCSICGCYTPERSIYKVKGEYTWVCWNCRPAYTAKRNREIGKIESPNFRGLENGKYPYIKIGEQIIKMKKEK